MRVNDSNNRIQDAANIQPSNTNTNQSSQSSLPKVTRLETALPATNRLIENQLGASLQKASLNSSLNQQGNITLASAQTSGASDSEKNQLILDLAQIGLSIAGVFDPTPISDGVDGAISLFRGDLLGAGISVASMIPYLGDLAKAGKLPKFLKVLDRAVDIAKVDPRFAERIKPLLQKVDDAVRGASIDSLPGPIKDAIVKMRSKLDEFFAAIPSHTKPTGAPGGTPTGVRVRINPKDAPENIRALTRQNDSADALARNGYKTDQLRESPTAGGKQPD
ncbi:MAG: hypothetical protein JNN15_14195, partial [Blastocatellia bacterium]|nr:hypothetical protein [Blastocatellia bacterium]